MEKIEEYLLTLSAIITLQGEVIQRLHKPAFRHTTKQMEARISELKTIAQFEDMRHKLVTKKQEEDGNKQDQTDNRENVSGESNGA